MHNPTTYLCRRSLATDAHLRIVFATNRMDARRPNVGSFQAVANQPLTSRISFEAEGMGFEPTTPLLGHHISSVAAGQFAYPPGVGRAFIVAGIGLVSTGESAGRWCWRVE